MKSPFKIYDSRSAIGGKSSRTAAVNRQSPIANRKSQGGVALIITLIMLSVITFMAVTFLVLSTRERSSVNGFTDQKIATMASDTALSRASADMLTRMILNTNAQNVGLVVSTNYYNYAGYHTGIGTNDPFNVNYDYINVPPYGPLVGNTRNQNIANLFFNPRPPVFVTTNILTGSNDFRYYLDLNRNGRPDTNGLFPVINYQGLVYNATNGALEPANSLGPVLSNNFVGDPEWIGILERPAEMHSADNKFIARYAYLVQPASMTLDVNYIHNRAKRPVSSVNAEGFLRNQGVSTFEINLAAFLADLNTNIWWNNGGYNYIPLGNNTGAAFTNANDLLSYRYGPNGYAGLATARNLIATPPALRVDGIDEYSDGPLMLGITNIADTDLPTLPWSGADNTNHLFSMQDFLDSSKVQSSVPLSAPNFPATLANLGTSNDSYNAYTFYRMLAQLGTDSAVDQTKININYENTDTNGNIVPGMETNQFAWKPVEFFTNAANAMFKQMNLRDFNGNLICITNIPIYEDPAQYGGTNLNYYTPAVHRVLQLAANIFDATTNQTVPLLANQTNSFFPSVFRPYFRSQNGIVSIAGYTEVTDLTGLSLPYLDRTNFATVNQPLNTTVNLVGVPWVIGAKTGLPNFNEFSMENDLTVTRKLQFTNYNAATLSGITNQMFVFTITNSFGLEAWNSYTNAFQRPLRLVASNLLSIVVSNEFGVVFVSATNMTFGTNMVINSWPGWDRSKDETKGPSFLVPLQNSFILTNGIYLSNPNRFVPLNPALWSVTANPHLYMGMTVRVQYYLIDTTANRVMDYVDLLSAQPPIDILAEAATGSTLRVDDSSPGGEWTTNTFRGIPIGILNQIDAGRNVFPVSDWLDIPPGSKVADQACFKYHLMGQLSSALSCSQTNFFQDPYSPSRTIFQSISWQANDPLVHYMPTDLTNTAALNPYNQVSVAASKNNGLPNLGHLNVSFQPWGGYPASPDPKTAYDLRIKDPGVGKSDDWVFMTNKFPNVGWLGRVHRGTPWQTVYMKSTGIDLNSWNSWTGDSLTNGNTLDASLTEPVRDYGLFDLFTTALNDNAVHGQLNVNQTNLASWSAVLSGVNVITNFSDGTLGATNIQPAGFYDPSVNPLPPVVQIVQGINAARMSTNSNGSSVFLNQTFQHAGDVLSAPQLTVASPFINTNLLSTANAGGVSDAVMERIPQQIMSLLTLNQTPRFVIYSFGQTLHPADHSLVIGGTFNGLCTNYQITAETATRAVVRVEGSLNSKSTNYPPHLVIEQFNNLAP